MVDLEIFLTVASRVVASSEVIDLGGIESNGDGSTCADDCGGVDIENDDDTVDDGTPSIHVVGFILSTSFSFLSLPRVAVILELESSLFGDGSDVKLYSFDMVELRLSAVL